ncbi:MAG: preprotein translocase subunit SecA [Bacteroidia bacterium]
MLDIITKGIKKIFGDKSERDIKDVQPVVKKINEEYSKLTNLSHNELRIKSAELRQRIADHVAGLSTEIQELRDKAQSDGVEASEQEEIFKQVDELIKKKDEEYEVVLEEVLPEAFAVMKDAARRFTENEELEVDANERDRELAATTDFVTIAGNYASYKNHWQAAGNEITWNMVHYDVQLIGGVTLHRGKIAEMATGEGKTLVATLPSYLNGLTGEGVHIVTVNDYLARRDAEWMRPILEFLGVSVDCIEYHKPHSEGRKKAYRADVTYGTNNEFGFDYLRDNMAHEAQELVQHKFHYAMIDEVDSVLVDDARTPLIISGPTAKSDQDHEKFYALRGRVDTLMNAQKKYVQEALLKAKKFKKEGNDKEAGLYLLRAHRGLPKNKALLKYMQEEGIKTFLQKTENFYMQDQQKEMPTVDKELYFTIEEKNRQVELTELGLELITKQGEDKDFFILPDLAGELSMLDNEDLDLEGKTKRKDEILRDYSVKSERIHTINQLLKAYTMFEKDVEYILSDDGKIKIVDEQTGRVMDGRRYSDGLHQAIEAKENVKVEGSTQTFATVTLQNFFRMYHKLAGMTGTAITEAGEFWEIYKLDVVTIPTNRPIVRDDKDDMIYKTRREKFNAAIDKIQEYSAQGRPVLVGTTSVEISELFSKSLNLRKIKHNVLNAKQHQREAEVVAEAGKPGTVTIATNMAGRGTDIKLAPGVKEAGGLAIIGTERHDSRRVDRQLRGRAGRQGDPGSSEFFVSLEDNLMRLFGSERIAKVMDNKLFGMKDGEVIQHPMISKSIERAQKKVEENNFGVRKRLLEYDDVMNSQREVIYTRRKNALNGERLQVDLNNIVYDLAFNLIEQHQSNKDYEEFSMDIMRVFAIENPISAEAFEGEKAENLAESLYENLYSAYKRKSVAIAEQALPVLKRIHEDRGDSIETVVIPFTDGQKGMNVPVNLQKALSSDGKHIIESFDRGVTLATIDELWKDHLREMDDLKQSVQNAHLEQKDPLLIYKFEAYELFQGLLDRINRQTLEMVFKGHIQTDDPEQVRQQRQTQKRTPKLNENRGGEAQSANGKAPNQPEKKLEPIRVGEKVGRNEPCPCGSGKKYKQCHGRNA